MMLLISNFAQSLKEFKEASKLEGKQEGLIEGKCEVAKNMLAKFDDQMIVELTGLELEVIQALRREQEMD